MPITKGISGPMIVKSIASAWANASNPEISSTAMATFSTEDSSAVPGLPGATNTFSTLGDCLAFQARACSRPPPPTMRIFILILVFYKGNCSYPVQFVKGRFWSSKRYSL